MFFSQKSSGTRDANGECGHVLNDLKAIISYKCNAQERFSLTRTFGKKYRKIFTYSSSKANNP